MLVRTLAGSQIFVQCLILWCAGCCVVFSYSDGRIWWWRLGHLSCVYCIYTIV